MRRLPLPALLALAACDADAPKPEPEPTREPTCGPIYVAQAGYDGEDPVPADFDAPTFGHERPDPFHVHLSWKDDPSTTLAVLWRTDGDTLATRVQYGLDDSYGLESEGASFFVGMDGTHGRVHEAQLCGLQPGTTYHYRVGGEGHWSPDYTFTTAPAPGSEAPFRFGVLGDSRDDQATFGLLLDAMEAAAPDFYVFTGDAVQLGVDMVEWDAWFDAGVGHFERRPVMFAHGNHEFQTQNWYALFAQPGNEQWFSFDYANSHFVFLNDTVARAGDRDLQAAWMADDLAASDARWKFAVHHMPAYSSCTAHGSDLELQQIWSPIEEAGGVAVDFAGHNHNYERSYPLAAGGITTPELGTTYVVAAGAGAVLYGNEMEHDFTEVAAVTEHYVLAQVDGATFTLTAHDLAGNVLDTFTTTR